jgi:hypothetical protein
MKDIHELIEFLRRDSDVLFGDTKWHKRWMEIFISEKLGSMLLDHLNTFPKELMAISQVLEKVETGKVSPNDIFGYEGIGTFKFIIDKNQKMYSIQKLY